MSLRTRVVICVCILSVLVSLIIFRGVTDRAEHVPQYTEFSEGIATTNGVYFTENWNNQGWIYRIDSEGKVEKLMSAEKVQERRVEALNLRGGDLYGLFSSFGRVDDSVRRLYRVTRLDADLHPVSVTGHIVIDDNETVTSLSLDDNNFYITAIEKDGSSLNVYSMPINELKDMETAFKKNNGDDLGGDTGEEIYEPDIILNREASGSSFFVNAYYNGTSIEIRSDHDAPAGTFQMDSRVRSAVNKMRFSFGQRVILYRNFVMWWIGGLLIWFILVAVFTLALRRRNKVFYEIVVVEAVLLIALVSCFLFIRREYMQAGNREYVRFAILTLQGEEDNLGEFENVDFGDRYYFQSEDYRRIQNSMSRFIIRDGNSAVFQDVFLMRLSDGMIVTSVSGKNMEKASLVYGNTLDVVCESLRKHDPYDYESFSLDGQEHVAVGVTEGRPTDQYALVGIIAGNDPDQGLWGDTLALIILFVIMLLLGSALIIVVLYLQGLDVKRFEQDIRAVALGQKTNVDIPYTPALDLQSMWMSLAQIGKHIEEMNYDKFRIFEAYYRFAPKNIETIMGKESIFDVKNGDYVDTTGTLMLVSSSRTGEIGEKQIKSLGNIISYTEQFSDRKEGVLVSRDSELSILQFLFLKERQDVIHLATQMIHRNMSDNEAAFFSVFLYYCPFRYGIAGVKAHSLGFLSSGHSKEYEAFAKWFQRMRLYLVITDSVRARESGTEIRFIGNIRLEGEEENRPVFEVLDACPARERQMKLINKEKFEATLNLFYEKDFYLARNRFSEILRDCPEDEITKWYLFECERYLSEVRPGSDFGAFRITE
ncbi:MAG: hypothetical protein K5985_07965, partial [Lachnospiraceae bacterium]|nr:hypothetical protein [Lachnospiraceae bacterium]